MLSPKKAAAERDAIEAADQPAVAPGFDAVGQRRARTVRRKELWIGSLIQVSGRPAAGAAQASIDRVESRCRSRTSKRSERTVRARRRETWKRSSGITPRRAGSTRKRRSSWRASAIGKDAAPVAVDQVVGGEAVAREALRQTYLPSRRSSRFQPVDVVAALEDVGLVQQVLEQRDGGLDAADDHLAQAALQAGHAFGAVAAVDDQLAGQAVVVGRDRVAGVERRIEPHAEAAGRVEVGDQAGRGREGARVLGVDAALDGVALERRPRLA